MNAATEHLGQMLRLIRRQRGMTGDALANATGISQSRISKIETGKYGLPEWSDMLRLLTAIDASDEEVLRVRRQYEIAQLDPSSYAYMVGVGVEVKQAQFLDVERSARNVRDYQTSVFPGLLQTPLYAYRVFRKLGHGDQSAREAAMVRQRRQAILSDARRRFVFVVNDAALFSQHGADSREHWEQLDHVHSRVSAHNVSFHVLDSRRGYPVSAGNPFVIYDRRFVSAETTMRELTTSSLAEIEAYERAFNEAVAASLDQGRSLAMLREAIGRFSS